MPLRGGEFTVTITVAEAALPSTPLGDTSVAVSTNGYVPGASVGVNEIWDAVADVSSTARKASTEMEGHDHASRAVAGVALPLSATLRHKQQQQHQTSRQASASSVMHRHTEHVHTACPWD
jgi:hypothetical protein